VKIAFLIKGQGIGQLVFVEIQEDRRKMFACQGLEVRQIHHVRGKDGVIERKIPDFIHKIQGRPTHAPFPEPGRQGFKGDVMAGTGFKSQGKVLMGTAEKRLKKEDFHFFINVSIRVKEDDEPGDIAGLKILAK